MRKTSFGLGLAGTIIAFLVGVIMLLAGLLTTSLRQVEWDEISNLNDIDIDVNDEDFHFSADTDLNQASDVINIATGIAGAYLIISSTCAIIAGILGIVGICITKKRQNVGAGIMLLVAAILCIPSLWGLHATALFIPAGILAFLKDKHKQETISEVNTI